MLAVIYEDRPNAYVGVQLAALSLARHSPGLRVRAIVPGAPESFRRWAQDMPSLELVTTRDGIRGESWNVKPSVLRAVLADEDDVLWFDSDMIVTGDLVPRLTSIPNGTLVATEEYFWGHGQGNTDRTTGLGLRPARTFPAAINTGLVRVDRSHLPLIDHWIEILASPEYLAVIGKPAETRPLHFGSEQNVLTGLMGSTLYADIPVEQLRRGVEIAQCYGPSGWTVKERWKSRKRLPLVVHAMGAKPWNPVPPVTVRRPTAIAKRHLEVIHQQLTPYVVAAATYRGLFQGDDSWLAPRTAPAKLLSRLTSSAALQELPLALVDSAQRGLRRRLSIGQMGS